MTYPPPGPLPEVRLSSLARTVSHWALREPLNSSVVHDPELFDLHAPYQRGSVWTTDQRVALVKSLVMGLPTGAVITSALPTSSPLPYRVVDGKQRIEAVRAFLADEVAVPGWWFSIEDTTDREGAVVYSQLTERGRRTFANRQMPELLWNGEVEFLHPKPYVDGKPQGWVSRRRSPEELLVAEAELYTLVNGAGTPQTEADMARARAVAGGQDG